MLLGEGLRLCVVMVTSRAHGFRGRSCALLLAPGYNLSWVMRDQERGKRKMAAHLQEVSSLDVGTFPLKNGGAWTLDPQWLAEIETCYPYLPVRDEFSKAKGWLLGNPTKRKTARGMTRYLIGWLNRAEDSRLKVHRQLVKQQGPKYVNIGAWTTECQDEHGGTCGNQHFHRAKMQFAKASQRVSA